MQKAAANSIACLRPAKEFSFRRDQNEPLQLERRVRYTNKMSVPVTVIGRDGLSFTLPPDPVDPIFNKTNNEVLIVEISIDSSTAVKIDTDQKYSGGTSDTCTLNSMFISSRSWNGYNACFQYSISRKELFDRQQCVYIADIDLVVTTLNYEQERVAHPYSRSKALNVAIDDIDAHLTYSTLKFMMVDNTGLKDRRWVMCGNSPFAIDPVKVNTLDDGLYVFTNGNTGLDKGKGRTTETYYPWQEIDTGKFTDGKPPLKLYCSYEEALRYGDEESQHEIEIKRVQRELSVAKLDLEKLKNEHETKRVALETETAEQKIEREKKALETKEQYEERSNQRREQVEAVSTARKESLQWGAFAISVVGLLIAVLGHLKPKK